MNATHSGIHLIFKKLDKKFKLNKDQIEAILNRFFGDKEFGLVSSNSNQLIWYSFNPNLISLCNEFIDFFSQLSVNLNVYLDRIKVNDLKLNLNSNHQTPIEYEQNPNIFFIGKNRRSKDKKQLTKQPNDDANSNKLNDLFYCLRFNLFAFQNILVDFISVCFIFPL